MLSDRSRQLDIMTHLIKVSERNTIYFNVDFRPSKKRNPEAGKCSLSLEILS